MDRVKTKYSQQDTDAVNALLGLDKEKRNQAIAEDYIKASSEIRKKTETNWKEQAVTLSAYGLGSRTYNQLDPEVKKIVYERIESEKNEKKKKEDEKKENEEKKEEESNESSA